MHIFCKHDYSSKFIYFRLRNFSISTRLLSFQVIESQTWTWTHRPPKSSIEPAPPPLPESREAETRFPLLKKQTRKSVRYRSALAHCTVISFPRLLPPVPLAISRPPSRPAHRLSDEREAGRPRVQARSSSPPPEPRPPASRPPRRRNGQAPRPLHQPPPALLLVRPAAPLRAKC